MNIKLRSGYVLHKTDVTVSICKNLNNYELSEMNEATSDLVKLLAGEITEKNLLKECSKKKIF